MTTYSITITAILLGVIIYYIIPKRSGELRPIYKISQNRVKYLEALADELTRVSVGYSKEDSDGDRDIYMIATEGSATIWFENDEIDNLSCEGILEPLSLQEVLIVLRKVSEKPTTDIRDHRKDHDKCINRINKRIEERLKNGS